jgi:hypothetical protein
MPPADAPDPTPYDCRTPPGAVELWADYAFCFFPVRWEKCGRRWWLANAAAGPVAAGARIKVVCRNRHRRLASRLAARLRRRGYRAFTFILARMPHACRT